MPLPSLATIAQLEARLGHTVDAVRAQALLDDASNIVRGYTRQTLSRVENDKVVLRFGHGRVVLPQRPADKPSLVERADGSGAVPAVSWWWSGLGEIDFMNYALVANGPFYRHAMRAVIVTYSHGYAEIPGEIVAVVCQMVGRVIDGAVSTPGLRSEAIDDYKADLGGGLVSGSIALVPDEKETLDKFRVRAGSVGLR